MKLSSFYKCLSVFKLITFSFYSNASITVYPIELNIGATGNAKIEVMSQSDKVSFVKVTEKKIIDAGTAREREVEVQGIDADGLIITPLKLAVTPGSSRIIRLVTLNPPEKETTWRVYVKEISADEFNSADGNVSHNQTNARVGVNIIWGALVHVLPRQPSSSLGLNIRDYHIYNTGTLRIKINAIGECRSDKDCKWIQSGQTIYPETNLKIFPFKFSPSNTYKVKYTGITDGKISEIPLVPVNR